MSIEQNLEELTKAIDRLTKVIAVAGGEVLNDAGKADSSASVKSEGKGKVTSRTSSKVEAKKTGVTKAQVTAVMQEVKETFDTATARSILKAHGFDKLADVTEESYQDLYDAAKAKIEGEGEEGDGDSGDGL